MYVEYVLQSYIVFLFRKLKNLIKDNFGGELFEEDLVIHFNVP